MSKYNLSADMQTIMDESLNPIIKEWDYGGPGGWHIRCYKLGQVALWAQGIDIPVMFMSSELRGIWAQVKEVMYPVPDGDDA